MRTINDELAEKPCDESTTTLSAKVIRESEKALMVAIEGVEGCRWIPKSVVHDDSEVFRAGHQGKLVVMTWFIEQQEAFKAARAKRRELDPLPDDVSLEALGWLEVLRAHADGKRARPSKALVELERRGLATRSEGPGADTMWRANG